MPDFIIREAVLEDAPAFIAYMKVLSDEPDNGILYGPGEFDLTLERETEFIQNHIGKDNSIVLVAESTRPADKGAVIAITGCGGGRLPANRHTVGFGISVAKAWRDQGVGTALMEAMIQWARDTGVVKRIELDVFAHNTRAIHVYEKLGFQREGVKKQAYFKDGRFVDALFMALLL